MVKVNYLAQFAPAARYHVYNRTNNKEPLFLDDRDRRFFLDQYKRFVAQQVDTYAYCLLPNHFHFAISIKELSDLTKSAQELPDALRSIPQRNLLRGVSDEFHIHSVVERQFTRMFTAYASYFNTRYGRKGNLFHRPFQRIACDDDNHWVWLIYYIHQNPRKHNVMADFRGYTWSSYQSLISTKSTMLNRDAVMELFLGKPDFIAFHEEEERQVPENWLLGIEC